MIGIYEDRAKKVVENVEAYLKSRVKDHLLKIVTEDGPERKMFIDFLYDMTSLYDAENKAELDRWYSEAIENRETLRDRFAMAALGGMSARDSFDEGQATPEQRATLAYIDADAMLEARKVKA